MRRDNDSPIRMAEMAANLAQEKSAEHVVIMDMSRVSGICDFFVLCSASSTVRAKTIADSIERGMREEGHRILHRDGMKEGRWIVMDFGEVVTHIFLEDARKYYNLENLWGDAPRRTL